MKGALLGIAAAVGLFALIFGLGWAIEGNDFLLYKTFAPKVEAVRNKTFKESQAYNDGMAQDLAQAEQEYTQASKSQQAALRSIILHRFSSYESERLPLYLQNFLNDLRKDQQ